jgi:radical SAM superfamily enzyme with C-terminal helix-hairpin-helix motif
VLAASTFDLIFQIGGLAATGAFVAGTIGVPPNIKRLSALESQLEAFGGPPTPEQAAEMHEVLERMRKLSRLDLALIASPCSAWPRRGTGREPPPR